MELVFGGMPDAARFVVAFILVLSLIGAGALLWRRFGAGPLSPASPRGRQPRLAVIDAAAVDGRRQLVLIKRDNVEHLLMIGGPTDIVVESNINRAAAVSREPRPIPDISRQAIAADGPDWTLPLEPVARPLRTVDLDAALPEPQARSAREAMADSMRAVRSGTAARRGPAAEPDAPPEEIAAPALTPSSPELGHRPPPIPEPRRVSSPEGQRPQPVSEPASQSSIAPEPKRAAPRPAQPAAALHAGGPAAAPPRPAPPDEKSLAEMAQLTQRLEAALRRPTKPAESPPGARSPIRSEPPVGRKPPHLDPVAPAKGGRPSDQPPAQPPDLKVLPGKAKAEPPIESLEDEMAKMLGRSPGKS